MDKDRKEIIIKITDQEMVSFKEKSIKMGYKNNLEVYAQKIFTSKHHIPSQVYNEKQSMNIDFSFYVDQDYYLILQKRAKRLDFESKFQSFLRKVFFTKYFVSDKFKPSDKEDWINVRISPSEKQHLKGKAESIGMNMSDYFRNLIFKKDIILTNPHKLIDELYSSRAEINKIGSNINQIANYANFLSKQRYVESEIFDNFKEEALAVKIKLNDLKKIIDKTIKRV